MNGQRSIREEQECSSRLLSLDWQGGLVSFQVELVANAMNWDSGSNYGYSAYAPQLANQLVISATMINLIGLAGNFGMYASGPVWGKIVDSKGQKM